MGKFKINSGKYFKNSEREREEDNKEIEGKTTQETREKIIKDRFSNIKNAKSYISKINNRFNENFNIEECIGAGSESFVYKTKIKKNGRIIATKMIVRDIGEKANINEINISKKLKNLNIINIYGASTIRKDEVDCIMMEFTKFGNLRDFQKKLKRNILSESFLCFMTYQILNALNHCHKCKIAHLDLKPQNIVVDESLNLKLIDFSISIDYSQIYSEEIIMPLRGTNFYISPEILSSRTIKVKDINKIDLYSLGVILYNLAFGHYPFGLNEKDVDDFSSIYNKITSNFEIKNDKNYSPYFIDFLGKLLEKDIDKRIDIYEALNHYWVKGGELLFKEKENLYNIGNFLIYLITDHFKSFNDYIKKEILFF